MFGQLHLLSLPHVAAFVKAKGSVLQRVCSLLVSATMRWYRFNIAIFFVSLLLLPGFALAAPTLQEMTGQMLLVGFRGTTITADHPIVRDIRERHLGGVILFDYDVQRKKRGRNIVSPEQLQKLTAQLQYVALTGTFAENINQSALSEAERKKVQLFIAVDQEGGKVARLSERNGFLAFPSAAALGRLPVDTTLEHSQRMGQMLAEMGINLNFAPVLDVNVTDDSPVIGAIERSFSAVPAEVGTYGQAVLHGLRKHGVLGCVKHFPGHGSASKDSHKGVTDISATWTMSELLPFQMLIDSGDVELLMTGHLFNAQLDADYPATLSSATLTDLLRLQLGYQGIIISDDMQMKAITDEFGLQVAVERALTAGADILLFGNNLVYQPDIVERVQNIVTELVRNGRISRERIAASYQRILKVKRTLRPVRITDSVSAAE